MALTIVAMLLFLAQVLAWVVLPSGAKPAPAPEVKDQETLPAVPAGQVA